MPVADQHQGHLQRGDGGREQEARGDGAFYTRWWFWTLVGGAVVAGGAALVYTLTRPADDVVYTFQAVRAP